MPISIILAILFSITPILYLYTKKFKLAPLREQRNKLLARVYMQKYAEVMNNLLNLLAQGVEPRPSIFNFHHIILLLREPDHAVKLRDPVAARMLRCSIDYLDHILMVEPDSSIYLYSVALLRVSMSTDYIENR